MASQLALRDSFLKKHPNLRYGLGEWRRYKDGVWAPVNELEVKKQMQVLIQSNGSANKLSNGLVTSLTELIRQYSYIPDDLFDANPSVLTFNNVCLNLATLTETPHSPTYYNTTKLNYDYDPTARSDAWEKVLKHCPHPEFFQEFAGLCTTPVTKHELALWLYGPPGGGKSTFIAGLEAMLGPRCCVLGLNEIEKTSFGLAQIPGKTLAISTEQPAHFIKSVNSINTLISGESITINRKFVPQYTITPRVKLLWAMNELPRIDSSSGAGIFRRVLPMYCPPIAEHDRDPEIKEEILRSGMAIMNWSLPGLDRLRKRSRFDIPRDLLVARESYRTQSDITLCFVEEGYIQGENCDCQAGELYEAYNSWCVKNGHRPLASNRFTVDLERLGFHKSKRNTGNFWIGLELKPDFPDLIVE